MKTLRIQDSADHISNEAISQSSAKLIPSGSILFVVRGMILNHTFPVALTERELAINQDMKALVPTDAVLSEFLLFYGLHMERRILFEVKAATHGTRRLETNILKSWAVPLPPLSEQLKIVQCLQNASKRIESILAELGALQTEHKSLDQSILAKAFRGDLVPQNPNDEPASILLERIRTEREKLGTTKKKGRTTRKKTKPNSGEQLSL